MQFQKKSSATGNIKTFFKKDAQTC